MADNFSLSSEVRSAKRERKSRSTRGWSDPGDRLVLPVTLFVLAWPSSALELSTSGRGSAEVLTRRSEACVLWESSEDPSMAFPVCSSSLPTGRRGGVGDLIEEVLLVEDCDDFLRDTPGLRLVDAAPATNEVFFFFPKLAVSPCPFGGVGGLATLPLGDVSESPSSPSSV